MTSGVGLRLIALPGLRIVGRCKACIYICAIAVLNGCWTEISAEAIIGVVACAVHVQGQIGKRAIRHTEIVTGAGATESGVRIEQFRLVECNTGGYVLGG